MYVFSIKAIKGLQNLTVDKLFTQIEVRIGTEVWILMMTKSIIDLLKMVLLHKR